MIARISFRNKLLLAAFLLISLAAGAALWVGGRNDRPEESGSDDPGQTQDEQAGFQERGRQSGLAFHMDFLPSEQGQNFKVNLYDHGCGVAVGDFDGDGHDDIYFLNQLGANALYRNKGDGTFEDVTARPASGWATAFAWPQPSPITTTMAIRTCTSPARAAATCCSTITATAASPTSPSSAGLVHVGHSQTAVFFDYDNDG